MAIGFFSPAYAYIDPGTGSMLLSVILGASTALLFVLNSLFIKIKMFLCSKTAKGDLIKNNIPYVIYCEGKQYFSVFKPVADEFEKRKIPLVFLTSAKDDPMLAQKYEFVECRYIGSGSKAYLNLAFLRADICLMTTPQLDVLQLKRSKFVKHYSHLFHSITFSMDYRLFGLDYYDSILCDGEFQIPLIREIEHKRNLPEKELVVVGSTYMDYLEDYLLNNCKINQGGGEEKHLTVLIAPSWGPDSLFRKFGYEFLDDLAKASFNVIIRPHPQSLIVEKEFIAKIKDRFKEYKNIQWNFDMNNIDIMSKSDILISDFSSIMFDYAFLFNKPFIFANQNMHKEMYDMCDIDGPVWRYEIMKEIGSRIKENNLKDIVQIINDMHSRQNEYSNKIEDLRKIAWEKRGNAAKNVADYLIKTRQKLTEEEKKGEIKVS